MAAIKSVLITGGTGSFGKTMLQELLQGDVEEIRVLSRDEEKQDALRSNLQDGRVRYYIGDIRDRSSVDLGSDNVIQAAVANKVNSLVCLSTDKAVMPINAMGMSKSLMEKLAQSTARAIGVDADTTISCVRYGNVMYSRGSVIPLFIKQIKSGQPITVTEPAMTRFLMPLRDSVALVRFAFDHARQGDLFVKKAPASTIADLVTELKELFGVPDNQVNVIGWRHAEKLYETLASAQELANSDDLGDYYRVRLDERDLNYNAYVSEGEGDTHSYEDFHSHNAGRLNVEQVKDLLLSLPEIRAELATWQAERARA